MIRTWLLLPVLFWSGCGHQATLTSTPASPEPARYAVMVWGVHGCDAIGRGLPVDLGPVRLSEAEASVVPVEGTVAVTDRTPGPGRDGRALPVAQWTTDEQLLRYRTRFDREGTYSISATLPDGQVISQDALVREPTRAALADNVFIQTFEGSAVKCATNMKLEDFKALALNQTALFGVVPVDAAGNHLKGLLPDLRLSGAMKVRQLLPGSSVPQYLLEPLEAGPQTLQVDAPGLGGAELSFEVSATPARCAR